MMDYTYASSAFACTRIESLRPTFVQYIKEQQNKHQIDKIQISFEVYLKSQLHYNILTSTNNRKLSDYNSAYNYMCGRTENVDSYKKVLRYYYEDIANLVFSLDLESIEDFSLVGENNIPRDSEILTKEVNLNQLIEDLSAFFSETKREIRENSDVAILDVLNCIPPKYASFAHKRLITEATLFRYYAKMKGEIVHLIWR